METLYPIAAFFGTVSPSLYWVDFSVFNDGLFGSR